MRSIAWLVATLLPVLAGCSVRLAPSDAPSATATPSSSRPTAAASLVTTLPPPPAGFEERLPLWLGDRTTGSSIGPYIAGIWVGRLGGELVPVDVEVPTGEYARTAGGQVYYLGPQGDGNGYESTLWQVTPTGEARLISQTGSNWFMFGEPSGAFAIAVGRVIVSRAAPNGRDGGVQSVGLETGDVSPILPPKPGWEPSAGLATNSDGSSIVAGRCSQQDGVDTSMEYVADGTVRDLEMVGLPIGFDSAERLVYWPTCTRRDVNRATLDGAVETLIDGEVNQARVTPDGRHLVAWSPREFGQDQPLIVIDLEDGDRWTLELDGDWHFTDLGENEFAVLEGSLGAAASPRQPLVISLTERWAVILPAVGQSGG